MEALSVNNINLVLLVHIEQLDNWGLYKYYYTTMVTGGYMYQA